MSITLPPDGLRYRHALIPGGTIVLEELDISGLGGVSGAVTALLIGYVRAKLFR
jgi:hypothetical protein